MTAVAVDGLVVGKPRRIRTRTLTVAAYLLWVAVLCGTVVRFGIVLPADAEIPFTAIDQ